MNIIILTIISYLLGAVPFGLLVARSKGVDIREHGSGNIGATNVLRVIGKGWGIFTLILDALKGFIPGCCSHRWSHISGLSQV
jgi:glycerol-3-phosphate acyltransferase PlsY